jgi:pilus assembly protein CpaC
MTKSMLKNGTVGLALAGGLAIGLAAAALPSPVIAASLSSKAPGVSLNLSQGRGQIIRLSRPMTDLFVADDKVADVQVRSSTVLYVFGKGPGVTTVSATDKAGRVVYSANVQVGNNFDRLGTMLSLAMPESHVVATPMNGLVLLTGTVGSPDDVEQATQLVTAFVGTSVQVVNRLKTATPLQVNLQVKIAEVNRNFIKSVGVNLLTRDTSGGFLFGVARGNAGTIATNTAGTAATNGFPIGATIFTPQAAVGATTLNAAGHALGLDILGTLDLAENDGLVHTLAEPNLTALSGETASFLAGGEIPIPVPQYQGTTTIEYKQYGVSLAFTPTVLADGRISMRVRPEVSTLTGSTVSIQGYNIPGLTTRRAETTVELGSGQSFMIGGLINNANTSTLDKAPFLGDLPILGALFRSQSFRREETELVIIVTPYLVQPVTASALKLPTDGYQASTDVQRFLGGQTFGGKSGDKRPVPTTTPVAPTAPVITGAADPRINDKKSKKPAPVAPGFALN